MSLQTQYHVEVSHLCDFTTSVGPQEFYNEPLQFDSVREMRSDILNDPKRLKAERSLLIIDPQRAFMKANTAVGRYADGSLSVPNSNEDIENIIGLIKAGHFGKIYVSLDTHSPRHIGHPMFWEYYDAQNNIWRDATNDQAFNSLENDRGLDMKWYVKGTLLGTDKETTFRPKQYVGCGEIQNKNLREYVWTYLETIKEQKKHMAIIWPYHCLEEGFNDGTLELDPNGHKVAQELKTCLDNVSGATVSYIPKGRCNLSEMFSIFSAQVPVSDEWLTRLPTYAYDGRVAPENFQDDTGTPYYKGFSNNISTETNDALMKKLFGYRNEIFVCGEAATHCVKDSVIDLIKYAERHGIDPRRIVLLRNSTSPIPTAKNDLVKIMEQAGCRVMGIDHTKDPMEMDP
jgi:nicotinamidase-related amidase